MSFTERIGADVYIPAGSTHLVLTSFTVPENVAIMLVMDFVARDNDAESFMAHVSRLFRRDAVGAIEEVGNEGSWEEASAGILSWIITTEQDPGDPNGLSIVWDGPELVSNVAVSMNGNVYYVQNPAADPNSPF